MMTLAADDCVAYYIGLPLRLFVLGMHVENYCKCIYFSAYGMRCRQSTKTQAGKVTSMAVVYSIFKLYKTMQLQTTYIKNGLTRNGQSIKNSSNMDQWSSTRLPFPLTSSLSLSLSAQNTTALLIHWSTSNSIV